MKWRRHFIVVLKRHRKGGVFVGSSKRHVNRYVHRNMLIVPFWYCICQFYPLNRVAYYPLSLLDDHSSLLRRGGQRTRWPFGAPRSLGPGAAAATRRNDAAADDDDGDAQMVFHRRRRRCHCGSNRQTKRSAFRQPAGRRCCAPERRYVRAFPGRARRGAKRRRGEISTGRKRPAIPRKHGIKRHVGMAVLGPSLQGPV